MYNPKMQCTEIYNITIVCNYGKHHTDIMQTTVFYNCGKTNTQHITKMTVLYNPGKQNTNIKQTLQYYTTVLYYVVKQYQQTP